LRKLLPETLWPGIPSLACRAKLQCGLCLFISITLAGANLPHVDAQQVTTVAPPVEAAPTASEPPATASPEGLADAPEYPDAVLVPSAGTPIKIETAPGGSESYSGPTITLDGGVVIAYRDRTLRADHIVYNSDTGDATLTGHVVLSAGESDERIEASRGTLNVRTLTGSFYDVSGAIGLRRKALPAGDATVTQRAVYANGNPFLFTGRMVVRTGPRQFQIFNGTITSCTLPHPDWVLSGAEFSVDGQKAHATNSIFRLMNVPVLWLPYVTHPTDASDRQTGVLIPEFGINSASKGDTIGEQVYWAIDRSTDLTVGTIYYSARGWEQTASLRHRGLGQNFLKARYSGLQDRGYYPGGIYVNQSGTDVLFSGRHDFIAAEQPADPTTPAAPANQISPVQMRAVADLEYLSSFPYREAFSTNFNQAVSSDVVSTLYLTRESSGVAASLEGDRYQGEKRVANTTVKPPQTEEQVHIFHAPALEFTTVDRLLGATSLEWNLDSSVAALKRTQPNFETSGLIERLDIRPELAYPFGGFGWRIRPSIAGRETFYSRSRFVATASPGPGLPNVPVENTATLNRADLDLQFDIRPPVLEKTFNSGFLRNLLRHDFRHTIEPQFLYRYVDGVNSFNQALRFDDHDIVSNTNELQYGLTQRLFLRRNRGQTCRAPGLAADANEIFAAAGGDADAVEDPAVALNRDDPAEPICGDREWISWQLAQKYFFDPNFGGAITSNGPRDILETTLDFSGISFLTGPRNISPLLSRLRVRTSEKTDVEWDFDFDTCSSSVSASTSRTLPCQSKFTSNNVYVDVHQGSIYTGVSYARLNAPARSYVDGVLSSVADFDQMRVWFGFRRPTDAGFSAAANAGIDIDLGTVQYGAIQTSYNWNCCGISLEYRKYELGTARNDNGYKFNFTLANIGSAGNIKHAGQVF
jgi:LPS-assembly protein